MEVKCTNAYQTTTVRTDSETIDWTGVASKSVLYREFDGFRSQNHSTRDGTKAKSNVFQLRPGSRLMIVIIEWRASDDGKATIGISNVI